MVAAPEGSNRSQYTILGLDLCGGSDRLTSVLNFLKGLVQVVSVAKLNAACLKNHPLNFIREKE
jgi:hypothetical protein